MEHPSFFNNDDKFSTYTLTPSDIRSQTVLAGFASFIRCVRGVVRMEVNDQMVELVPDSVMHILPNDLVRPITCSDDFEAKTINFSMPFLHTASLNIEKGCFTYMQKHKVQYTPVLHSDVVDRIMSLLESIEADKQCVYRTQMAQTQLRVLLLLYADFSNREDQREIDLMNDERSHQYYHRFMELLRLRHRDSREVMFYANELCISPKHLNNISRKVGGHHAKALIDYFVVTQLKNTLRNTNKTIAEISDEYHFPSQSFLSRFFKSRTGLSPTQFKRQGK